MFRHKFVHLTRYKLPEIVQRPENKRLPGARDVQPIFIVVVPGNIHFDRLRIIAYVENRFASDLTELIGQQLSDRRSFRHRVYYGFRGKFRQRRENSPVVHS